MSVRVSMLVGGVAFMLIYFGSAIEGRNALTLAVAVSVVAIAASAVLAVRYRRPMNLVGGFALAAYITGGAAHREWPDTRWIVWTTAAVVLALVLVSMTYGVRAVRASKEFERFVNTEATSLAFFVVTISAGAYGLLESYLDLPELPANVIFLFAMCTWSFLKYAVERRLQ
jgi:hypothetical protein